MLFFLPHFFFYDPHHLMYALLIMMICTVIYNYFLPKHTLLSKTQDNELVSMKVKGIMLVAQSCPTLCNQIEPTRFLCHGILQAKILEWIAIPFSRGSSGNRDRTLVSYIAGKFFTI